MAHFRRNKRQSRRRSPDTTDSIPWTPPKEGSLRARLELERRQRRYARQDQHGRSAHGNDPLDDHAPYGMSTYETSGDDFDYLSPLPDDSYQVDAESLFPFPEDGDEEPDLLVSAQAWDSEEVPPEEDSIDERDLRIWQDDSHESQPESDHPYGSHISDDADLLAELNDVLFAEASSDGPVPEVGGVGQSHPKQSGMRLPYSYADALRDIQEHGYPLGPQTRDRLPQESTRNGETQETLENEPQEASQSGLAYGELGGATEEQRAEQQDDSMPNTPQHPNALREYASREESSREEYEEEQYIKKAFQEFKRKRRKRKLRKLLGATIFLAIVGGGGYWWWTTQQEPEEADVAESSDSEMLTEKVRTGALGGSVKAEGATAPLSSSGIESQVSGTIMQVMVAEGDHVQKGAVLFTVTNDEYYSKVKDAENRVQEANNALGEAQKAFQDAYKAYEDAYNASMAADDWDSFDFSLETEAKRTDEEVRKAQQTLDAAKSAHEAVLAANAQESVRNVIAPISGNITKMKATAGMKIDGNGSAKGKDGGDENDSSLIQIVDISQMIVTVQVNEIDIAKVQPGQQAKVTFSALPEVESLGTVQKVANVASGYEEGNYDADPASRGVVTYAVTILIPEPDSQLKMGMTATAEISTSGDTQYTLVPEEALQEDEEGNSFVTVIGDNGDMSNVTVKVIAVEASEAAVEGDLKEGDIVTYEVSGIPDDMGELPDMPAGDVDEDYVGSAD